MMKLFFAPRTCAIGIQLLLEEVGADYELITFDIAMGDQHKPEFRQVNPKGKVPALVRDDGSVLTEFPAIAMWIARQYPEANLLPMGLEAEIRTLELLDYVVATIHMRGATLALVTQRFVSDEAAQKELRDHGMKVLSDGLTALSQKLGDQSYFFGDQMTIADAAVYYVLKWEERTGMHVPDNLSAFRERIEQRQAGKKIMELQH